MQDHLSKVLLIQIDAFSWPRMVPSVALGETTHLQFEVPVHANLSLKYMLISTSKFDKF